MLKGRRAYPKSSFQNKAEISTHSEAVGVTPGVFFPPIKGSAIPWERRDTGDELCRAPDVPTQAGPHPNSSESEAGEHFKALNLPQTPQRTIKRALNTFPCFVTTTCSSPDRSPPLPHSPFPCTPLPPASKHSSSCREKCTLRLKNNPKGCF